ncbi:hypothetical protein SEMRO_91_G047900.1 [Seminavis robusta]|uniref:Uncharacterized protein n=1 Tax=Seminavis robusta TaxID=568900 RepID=A0A9N8DFC8_9STRA|nr:hypothetical protein SEMRO_91_G047900.1 [Seminavis robusta]|eukprot:Sro91_g047900.1 n/a (155) ;mRNA; f:113279-113743
MSWQILSTITEDRTSVESKASVRLKGTKGGKAHLQGDVTLLSWKDDQGRAIPYNGLPSYMLRLDAERFNDKPVPGGKKRYEIRLPQKVWVTDQPVVRTTRHGNHQVFETKMTLSEETDEGIKEILFRLPIRDDGNKDPHELFFAALTYAGSHQF